ncbi:hypothetical protein [Haloferula sp. A504]|uniref:hypothetical protein n=1 Tax=Haloferula sp. A504 TaxID=3373601 RepID=UPI0031CA6D24|nr:hypothetical protein [Verrucomicrobiaceae bacterium E54]
MKLLLFTALLASPLLAEDVFPGADENSPSRAHYFSWINNTNEGATIEQTAANMGFFQWLHDEYGMVLDLYAFDAGAVDAPQYYGRPDTRKFRTQFPDGFGPAARMAEGFGGRLGVWLGPDGFGDTDEEKQARIDFLVSLCRDDNVELFKMDAVCGQLRDEKQPALIELMKEARKHQPDLIMLNHRLNLGPAEPYATTFLWEGAETYIDVHMANTMTATHNRAKALSRGLPPELKRLAEDHGVCLSSCLDYWADDLILQAFNRSMILAPQLYGSPWFLRDDEYPKLARIFNLHRKYRDILVKGMVLPEEEYGPHAVSRGDESTRLITLRNLTWEPVNYEVALDDSIGLTAKGGREARLFHPYEEILGKDLKATDTVEITVHPFRAALLLATTAGCDEPALAEGPYRVIKNVEGQEPVIEKLVPLDLEKPWHRKLADLSPTELPEDWVGLYEATVFAADNNALELRSLERSGPTEIPAVDEARQAFLDQPLMQARALSGRYMFDGDPTTVFDVFVRNRDMRISDGALRVDFATPSSFDRLAIHTQALDSTLIKNEQLGAQFSTNLVEWVPADELIVHGDTLNVYPPEGDWRYFRMPMAPERIAEIEAWRGDLALPRDDWRGSNLFAHPAARPADKAWSATVTLDEITPTSYLCVAIEGEHGEEGAYAALRVDGKPVGAPSRATSYPSNTWEYPVRRSKTGFTYFFPLDASHVGKEVEVVVLGMKDGGKDLKPRVWITARDLPFRSERP